MASVATRSMYRSGIAPLKVLAHIEVPMATTERVTVTLPVELVEGIDRFERNRSRFIAEAVAHELEALDHGLDLFSGWRASLRECPRIPVP